MNLSASFLFFFLYGFLGWCVEVAFATITEKRFVNRGFLNGPICPIYGFGIVTVLILLSPFHENLWQLALGSFALTSTLEFVTGFLLEKLFHTKWWDYSNIPLNLMGYVCVPFSLIWALLCVVTVRLIHPLIAFPVLHMPAMARDFLTFVLSALLVNDAIITLLAVRKLNARLKRLTELGRELHAVSDGIGHVVYEGTTHAVQIAEHTEERAKRLRDEAKAKRDEMETLLARLPQEQLRLLHAFPRMKSLPHAEALTALRERVSQHFRHTK